MNIKEKECMQILFSLLLHLLHLKHNNSGRKNIFFLSFPNQLQEYGKFTAFLFMQSVS